MVPWEDLYGEDKSRCCQSQITEKEASQQSLGPERYKTGPSLQKSRATKRLEFH